MEFLDPSPALLIGSLTDRLLLFVLLILSLAVHEFGHAWTALKLGDDTAQKLGRVTLNPVPHLDPVFSVLLPLALVLSGAPFLFGAGGNVPPGLAKIARAGIEVFVL